MARLGVATACFGLVMISSMVLPSLQHTTFTVGDFTGWIPGVDYNAWAKGKHFKVGDCLVFSYPSGHTVDEVFENDYNTCTAGNPITRGTSGNTATPLLTPGPHYFMCGVVGHCAKGMKLLVNVEAEAEAEPAPLALRRLQAQPAPSISHSQPPASY